MTMDPGFLQLKKNSPIFLFKKTTQNPYLFMTKMKHWLGWGGGEVIQN